MLTIELWLKVLRCTTIAWWLDWRIAPPPASADEFWAKLESVSVSVGLPVVPLSSSTRPPPPKPAVFRRKTLRVTWMLAEPVLLIDTAPPEPDEEFPEAAVVPPKVELRIVAVDVLVKAMWIAPPCVMVLPVALFPKKRSLSTVTPELPSMSTAPPLPPLGAVLFSNVRFRSVTMPTSVPVRIRFPGAPPLNVAPLPAP